MNNSNIWEYVHIKNDKMKNIVDSSNLALNHTKTLCNNMKKIQYCGNILHQMENESNQGKKTKTRTNLKFRLQQLFDPFEKYNLSEPQFEKKKKITLNSLLKFQQLSKNLKSKLLKPHLGNCISMSMQESSRIKEFELLNNRKQQSVTKASLISVHKTSFTSGYFPGNSSNSNSIVNGKFPRISVKRGIGHFMKETQAVILGKIKDFEQQTVKAWNSASRPRKMFKNF